MFRRVQITKNNFYSVNWNAFGIKKKKKSYNISTKDDIIRFFFFFFGSYFGKWNVSEKKQYFNRIRSYTDHYRF